MPQQIHQPACRLYGLFLSGLYLASATLQLMKSPLREILCRVLLGIVCQNIRSRERGPLIHSHIQIGIKTKRETPDGLVEMLG
jgi:hypothetical protein